MKIRLIACFVLCALVGCQTTKPLSKQEVAALKKRGFKQGFIEPSPNSSCPWTLTMVGSNLLYDPVNLQAIDFKTSNTKESVFFTYLPLRMQNRCKNKVPVRLIKVIKNKKRRPQRPPLSVVVFTP